MLAPGTKSITQATYSKASAIGLYGWGLHTGVNSSRAEDRKGHDHALKAASLVVLGAFYLRTKTIDSRDAVGIILSADPTGGV